MFDTSHLHPMLVHFPIALGLVGLLFEFASLWVKKVNLDSRCGEILLYLATFSALVAVLSGLVFTGSFAGKPGELRDIHLMLAVIATVLLCIASVFYLNYSLSSEKNIKTRKTGFIFYLLAAVFVAATGAVGGTLVYSYMIGL